MWNCIKSQIDGDADISLSAGNTNIIGYIKNDFKMIDNVNKPALAGLWPNKKNMNVVLDLGANIECNENNLIDFLNQVLHYLNLYPNEKPIVSLLNIGSEEIKGRIVKEYLQKLNELSDENNFIFNGYIEGNKIMDRQM